VIRSSLIRSLLGYPRRGQFLVTPRGQFSMAPDTCSANGPVIRRKCRQATHTIESCRARHLRQSAMSWPAATVWAQPLSARAPRRGELIVPVVSYRMNCGRFHHPGGAIGSDPSRARSRPMLPLWKSLVWCERGMEASMKCARICSTADSESRFDKVEIPTSSRQVHPKAAAFQVSANYAATGIRFTRIPSGARR
jgi:hypothetical protein